MKYLLDAPVVIAAIKGRLPVVLRLAKLKPGEVAVSVVSKLETEAALRAQARPQPRYAKLLRDFFGAVRVLDVGQAEAQQAVNVSAQARLSGFDLLIAGTALAHRLVFVTDRPAAFAEVANLECEKW